MRGRVDPQVIERFGWTPDQIIIKRVDEVGAEIPGWMTAAYNPSQPRDERGRWTEAPGYEGIHRPAGPGYGAPMTDPEQMMPDLLEHPEYYDTGDKKVDEECMTAIRKAVKGGPGTDITIYRGVPKDVETINPGDWVTPSRTYAQHHAEANLGSTMDLDTGEMVPNEGHVISETAKAGDLYFEGNYLPEWGWWPPSETASAFNLIGFLTTTEDYRYNPSQPRVPAGHKGGGRWTKGGWTGTAVMTPAEWASRVDIVSAGLLSERDTKRVETALELAAGKTTQINLSEVLVLTDREMPMSPLGKCLAYADRDTHALVLSKGAFTPECGDAHVRDSAKWETGKNFDVPTTVTDGLTVTLTHELGHIADLSLGTEQRAELYTRLSKAIGVKGPSREDMAAVFTPSLILDLWAMTHQPDIQKALGKYASTGAPEAIAEGWCEYILNDHPRPAAKAIGEYIEEVLGPSAVTAAGIEEFRYNPTQPRDWHGRWTSLGGLLSVPPRYGDLPPKAQAAVDMRMRKYGLTNAALDAEIEARLTPENIEAGKRWYPDANKYCADLAKKHPGVKTEQVIGMVAALSPQMRWWQNKDAARHMLDEMPKVADLQPRDAVNRIGGALRDNMEPAMRIARGEDIDRLLTGPKRRSFYDNILHPGETDAVTLDTRMLQVPIRAKKTSEPHEPMVDRDAGFAWLNSAEGSTGGAGYVALADSVRRVAAAHDLPPDVVQAAYWISVGGD